MAEWMAEGEEPEILFWVGSAGSFDERAKKISRSFVKILNNAGVKFGVLGTEESSSGDAVKRAGNEFFVSDASYDEYSSDECLQR